MTLLELCDDIAGRGQYTTECLEAEHAALFFLHVLAESYKPR